MTYGFDEDAWGDLIVALIITIIALFQLQSVWYIIFLPFLIITGSLIFAGISLLFSILSFWTIGNNDMANVVYDMKEFTKYPMALYNRKVKFILTFIFPLTFIATIPSSLIQNGDLLSAIFLCGIMIGSICFFIVAKMIWNYSLRLYQGTGS
ncbi:MAG: ABC-2 family transporter protein [Culicoidibacterales bacterium]